MRTVGPWINGDAQAPPARQWISAFDYGAVFLEDPIGERTGIMSFAAVSDQALDNLVVYTAGFPVDKPEGTMWASAGTIQQVTLARLFYDLDAVDGNSGGPIFDFDQPSDDRTIIGVHTSWTPQGNSAVRITQSVAAKLNAWIQEFS